MKSLWPLHHWSTEWDKDRVLQLLKILLEALIWLYRYLAGKLTFEGPSHGAT